MMRPNIIKACMGTIARWGKYFFVCSLLLHAMNVSAQQMILPNGHAQRINEARFNKDGSKMVTASDDGTVKVWDTRLGLLLADLHFPSSVMSADISSDGASVVVGLCNTDGTHAFMAPSTAQVIDIASEQMIFEMRGHKSWVNIVRFLPGNDRVITASWDGVIKIWDVHAKALVSTIMAHNNMLKAITFSNDGQYFVTASRDMTAKVWRISESDPLFVTGKHKNVVTSAQLSTDGKWLITASLDSTARIWNMQTGRLINLLRTNSYCRSASFSPDGGYALTVSDDNIGRIWDAHSGKLVRTLHNKGTIASGYIDGQDIITGMFSKDGNYVVNTSYNRTATIWNAHTGKLWKVLSGHSQKMTGALFCPDGASVLTYAEDGVLKMWDIASGDELYSIERANTSTTCVRYSNDGRYLLFTSSQLVQALDLNTGEILYRLWHPGYVQAMNYSHDGRFVVAGDDRGWISLWDAASGEFLYKINSFGSNINSVSFSADDSFIIAGCRYTGSTSFARAFDPRGYVKFYSIDNGALADSFPTNSPMTEAYVSDNGKALAFSDVGYVVRGNIGSPGAYDTLYHKDIVTGLTFSPDGKYLATASLDSTAVVWSRWGEKRNIFPSHGHGATCAAFSLDAKALAVGCSDGRVRLWSIDGDVLLKRMSGHTDAVTSISFRPSTTEFATASADNTIRVWDAKKGKCKYVLVPLDTADLMVQTSSSYFWCTPNAARAVHYRTKDLRSLTFEQLDVRYNRPDKVLETMGSISDETIQIYRQAYYQRIKDLEIDTALFSKDLDVPVASVIALATEKDSLSLLVRGKSITPLNRLHIHVNGCPLYGQKGKKIVGPDTYTFERKILVPLSYGRNIIEVSLQNVNGMQNIPVLYEQNNMRHSHIPKLYFMGIGCNRGINAPELDYSVKDIRDLVHQLYKKHKDRLVVDTLFNENVTKSNIIAWKEKLSHTDINDKVVMAYSGHGALGENDLYLVTTTTDIAAPASQGIRYTILEALVDSIPARQKLILIDACNSGKLSKDIRIRQSYPGERNSKSREYNIDQKQFNKMQESFVNISKGSGVSVIAASTGNQAAKEDPAFGNSLFIGSVLKCMKEHDHASVNDLIRYTKKTVPELTIKYRGKDATPQTPTTRSENHRYDWKIW